MNANDSIADDFEGEFDPIRQLSEIEAQNDDLVKRISRQRKLDRMEILEAENTQDYSDSNGIEKRLALDSDQILGRVESKNLKTYEKKRKAYKSHGAHTEIIEDVSTEKDDTNKNHGKKRKGDLHSRKESKKFAKIKGLKLYNSLEGPDPYLNDDVLSNPSNKDNIEETSQEEHPPKIKYSFQDPDYKTKSEKISLLSDESFDVARFDSKEIIHDDSSNEDPSIELFDERTPTFEKNEPLIEDDDYSDAFNEFKDFVPDISDFQAIKERVLSQLTTRINFPNLPDCQVLTEKYSEIYRMFEHTVRDNEGHSALIIGPRASGKTAMVNYALKEINKKYEGQYITVNLNAFIHSDDSIALREIARQLDENAKKLGSTNEDQSSNSLKDEGNQNQGSFEQRSISDTFVNILSILDKNVAQEEQTEVKAQQSSISIIFIIDEFEKFTNNHKQTLLYNLFDLSQSSSIPICVVGVSTKITNRELLEKRVRSRFSQRVISINKSSTLEEFWSCCKLNLTLNSQFISTLNNKKYGELWNKYFEVLFNEKKRSGSSYLKKIVFQNYYTLKNYKDFNNNCVYAIANITLSEPFPKDSRFKKYILNQSLNHIQSMVSSLSILELLLVIAAARWVEKSDLEVVNFNLAFKEYEDMIKDFNINSTISNASSIVTNNILTNIKVNQKIWSAKILKSSWEALYKLGVLMDSTGPANDGGAQSIQSKSVVISENKMVQLDVTLEELGELIEDSNAYKRLTKL